MKRLFYPAAVLAVGMAATHLLFTAFIFRSDLALHAKMIALKSAGYVVVPNGHVLPTLTSLFPAFCGALFFTLTAGAGLTLLTFLLFWIHRRLFGGHRSFLLVPAAIGLGLIVAVNASGWNPRATLFFLAIPAIVAVICHRWMPRKKMPGDGYAWAAHLAAIVIVALAWIPRMDGNVFINVRDFILLENSAGQAVNTFYYKYTLFPAELFKTLDQKLLKTASVQADDPEVLRRLENRLAKFDYLAVSEDVCDIRVVHHENRLLLTNEAGGRVEADLDEFMNGSKDILRKVSAQSDRNGFFRTFTFLSLIVGFPLSLYILVHALVAMLLRPVPPVHLRSVIASLVLMGIGIGAVIPLYGTPAGALSQSEMREKLTMTEWRAQRDALKAIAGQGIDPMRLGVDSRLAQSPHVPVRYWLARALGNSNGMEAKRMLSKLVEDPHPNVACMAFYGIGRSGNTRTADEILERLDSIPHWYVQWYAYKALKNTGWVQRRSIMAPSR